MKINNVNNNNTNFKAKLEVKIGGGFENYLVGLKDEYAIRHSQSIIDGIQVLKEAAPVMAKDNDLISITENCLTKDDGNLDVTLNGEKIDSLNFYNPLMNQVISIIDSLTGGVINAHDLSLLSKSNKYSQVSHSPQNENEFIVKYFNADTAKEMNSEITTKKKMIEKVRTLNTTV